MSPIPFPLEVVFRATPVSVQGSASTRQRWIARVAQETKRRLDELIDLPWLDDRILAVTIYYFPIARMQGDIDNIVKPILDGMKSVVFTDDNVVERVLVQRFEPGIPRSFSALTSQLGRALDTSPPVVYIRIDDDLA